LRDHFGDDCHGIEILARIGIGFDQFIQHVGRHAFGRSLAEPRRERGCQLIEGRFPEIDGRPAEARRGAEQLAPSD
jgi:hypothetical protein